MNPRDGGSHLSDSVVLKPCHKRNGMTGCSFVGRVSARHAPVACTIAPNPRADAALAALGERGGVGAEAGPQAALRRRDFLVQMNWADLRLANPCDLLQLDVPACRYIK
jgi:hypothetical protein